MQEKYLRCGGIFEFPVESKRRLKLEDRSKLTLVNLFAAQEIALEPLINYWLVNPFKLFLIIVFTPNSFSK